MATLDLFAQHRAGFLGGGQQPGNANGSGGQSPSGNTITSFSAHRAQVFNSPATPRPVSEQQSTVVSTPEKKGFVQKAKEVATKLIPQLDRSNQPVAPQSDIKITEQSVKENRGKKLSPELQAIADDSRPRETASGQLTPEAQKIAQDKLEPFFNEIDKVGKKLDQEKQRVQKDLSGLVTYGVVQPAFAPADEVDLQQIYDAYNADDSLAGRLDKAFGSFAVGTAEGLTGGIIRSDTESKTKEGKIARQIGTAIGAIYTMGKIGTKIEGIASGSQSIGQFIAKYPKLAKVVLPWAKNVLAFDIYGQLDPTTQNRFQKLAMDTAMGTLFSGIGSIKKGVYSIPTNIIAATGLAKAGGASWEDAITAGLIAGGLDATFRANRYIFEQQIKIKGNSIKYTPDQAIEQVQSTNLKGTEAGKIITREAQAAARAGKDIQIDVIAGKQSSRFQDFVKAKTPGGVAFNITQVDRGPALGGGSQMGPEPRPAAGQPPALPSSNAPAGTLVPTADSSGFSAALAQQQAAQAAAPTAINPVAPAAGVAPQDFSALRDANKARNMANSEKARQDALTGQREELRLDNQKNIDKVATYLGVENPKPETTVTVYRGSAEPIKEGDFVTDLDNATRYLGERENATIYEKQVQVQDLILGTGMKREWIYAPKAAVEATSGSESLTPTQQSKPVTYDYSSTQLDLPEDLSNRFTQLAESIPQSEISTADGQPGREMQPHITVLYGLDTQNIADIKPLVQLGKPVEVTLGKISMFENDNYDVLKVDVDGPELRALNKKLDSSLDTPGATFKDYKPHITIAYLNKGEGAKYVGDARFEGDKVTLDKLTFSTKDGKKQVVDLTEQPPKPKTPSSKTKASTDEFDTELESKTIKSLEEEARKYKSVEDFIASQGNFRDGHVAPGFDDTPVKQRMEDGGDFNLAEVVKGYHIQPKDYFDPTVGPRYYGYSDRVGMESLTAINNVKRGAKTITAYRSVPNEIDVKNLIDGDWVSFSKQYVIDHGESRFGEGEYKIIEQEVSPKHVWWDGNDIREWGYDTGKTKPLSRNELTNIWNKANQKVNTPSQTSAKASTDEFAQLPAKKGEAKTPHKEAPTNLKIIEFPEIVKFARELTGVVPKVMKLRPGLKGSFNPITQQIKLNRDLFSDEKQAARTLAHEIGHLVDFLAIGGDTMKRGNLLGRLASLKSYRKNFIAEQPPAEANIITPADRKALMKQAREMAKQPTEVTKEVVVGESTIDPKDVIAIWNDTKGAIKNPKLNSYIATLDDAQKVAIVKAALKGVIPEWVKFKKQIIKTITVKEMKSMLSKKDIREMYEKLLREEVEKRGLVQHEVVRDELKKLSFIWRPMPPAAYENAAHMRYRNSSEELYADAISVLFNDPLRLQQDAPVFYRSFFNYLDNKPKASEAFFDAWALLNKGEDAVLGDRINRINEMFKNDEDKFTALQLDRAKARRDVMFELKYELIDKNQRILDKVKEVQRRGGVVPDDENPKYLLDGYNYIAGKIKSFLDREISPWYSKLPDQGLTWEDVGKYMMLERIMNERKTIANPLGLTSSTAKPTLDRMEKDLGTERTAALKEAVKQFRAANKSVMEAAYKEGQLYGDELYAQMKSNESYAAFRVTDYLDKNITAKVYKQVGTLKDIGNPATATMAKMIATIRATERAKTNRAVVSLLKKEFPGEIEPAKTRWNGKSHVPVEPEDDRGMVWTYENGKAEAYYVDHFIADAVSYAGIQNMNILIKGLALTNSAYFRPLFVGINLGFQLSNFRKDFVRLYKTSPGLNPVTVMANYLRAVPIARRRALGIYDETINKMEDKGMLSVTYNDVLQGRSDEDKQIDDIFHKYQGRDEPATRNPLKIMAKKILHGIEISGNVIESLPKVAGYLQQSDKMKPQELADFVRTKSGSPDFLRRGNSTAATNAIFLFSNAAKEGMRGDYEAFTSPKTRSGYWFKTFLLDVLPKLLMYAATIGVFGGFVKKMYDNISEYNKTNYTPLPLGLDENGKTMWLVGGSDEMGQLIGALTWKSLNIKTNKTLEQGLKEIFNVAASEVLPGLSPAISAYSTTMQYLQGQNPYDTFRNREIIPEDAFKAGGVYALVPFLKYQFQSLGGSIIFGSSVLENSPKGNTSQLETVLNMPVASNILQRFLRVTDYGQAEQNRAVAKLAEKDAAIQRIQDKEVVDKAVREVITNGTNRQEVERELIRQMIERSGRTPETETRINRARNNFNLAIIRGNNDPNITSLMYSSTNNEKAAILGRLSNDMAESEFNDLVKEAMRSGVIGEQTLILYKQKK